MTEFFEPINVSATHIYHSALELSPLSSIVRRLYHHWQRSPSPRVVAGTLDAWNRSIHLSGTHCSSYTLSPCGRFVATATGETVEIRDPLSFELLSTLTKSDARIITYSPDGRSLAWLSDAILIIWDIQTGGAAKEIGYRGDNYRGENVSLVWSLDGGTIGTILQDWVTDTMLLTWDTNTRYTLRVCDVASGTSFSPGTLQSKRQPLLWPHDTSFRVMTVQWDCEACTIEISEVGSVLTKIESFCISESWEQGDLIGTFSPTTHRVSIYGSQLRILDVRNSECLLEGKYGSYSCKGCFSSDGSLFAVFSSSGLNVWKYIFGRYTPWREFPSHKSCPCSPLQGHYASWVDFPYARSSYHGSPLQFSPNLSSILGHPAGPLQVWYLDGPSVAAHCNSHAPLAVISPCGTYIATCHQWDGTITITNLRSQTSPQFIDTGMWIHTLALTGNILLVDGDDGLVAWRLTEEGMVDGVYTNRRAHLDNSIWTVSFCEPSLLVDDQTAFIGEWFDHLALHVYRIGTGEVVEPPRAPLMRGRWYNLNDTLFCQHYLHYHRLEADKACSEDDWPISFTTLREGWIKDPEGKHRLWMPIEWRTGLSSSCSGWLSNITTLWLTHETESFIAMF